MSCVFCQIIDGEAPARTVYETETVQAFLDAYPLTSGHLLVVPKTHHNRLADMPVDLARDVITAIHVVTPAVEAAVDVEATTIAFNNGRAAGQEVPHVHAHVVPRFETDGGGPIHRIFDSRPDQSPDELDAVQRSICEAI